MTIRYNLPTLEDLHRLGERREHAITIYAHTSPIVSERATSLATAKSAFDTAVNEIKETGADHATLAQLRQQWESIAGSDEPWANLSSSLAIFLAPDLREVYVLPNRLENQYQAADYFDLGQLVRAVTSDQYAYALTLSSNGWNLWEATPTRRAVELELVGEYPEDAAEATNRATIRGRQHAGRLVGHEGRKTLLEAYAKRVAEAVTSELHRLDPHAVRPLFVFAAEPLLDIYCGIDHSRRLVRIPGAADELRPDQIDQQIREQMPAINAERVNAELESIGNDISNGLVLMDLRDIARAATYGAVKTLVYDFTIDIFGTMDEATGEVSYATDGTSGYDLLSRIAVLILNSGGEVIAVRSEEVSATIWNQTAVAHLRFPLG